MRQRADASSVWFAERGYYKVASSEGIQNFNNDEYSFEMDTTSNAVTEEWTVKGKDNDPDENDRSIIARAEHRQRGR